MHFFFFYLKMCSLKSASKNILKSKLKVLLPAAIQVQGSKSLPQQLTTATSVAREHKRSEVFLMPSILAENTEFRSGKVSKKGKDFILFCFKRVLSFLITVYLETFNRFTKICCVNLRNKTYTELIFLFRKMLCSNTIIRSLCLTGYLSF